MTADNLRVLNTEKPDFKAEFAKYLRSFADDVEKGERPIPDVALLYVTTAGCEPQLYATGSQVSPMGVLATADLCREAALVHATRAQYGVDDDE